MNPTHENHDVSDPGFDNVLAEYMLQVDRGEPVDREAYMRDHPDFASQLREYFETVDHVDALATSSSPQQVLIEAAPLASRQDSPPADTAELGPGTILGEYELIERIGEGGMGAVYKARHTKLKRHVAVKVLPQRLVSEPKSVARFEREMESVGRLDHPYIVRAMDAREIAGQRLLVMEFVPGMNLEEVAVQCGRLRIADACELARQVAEGLQNAHENGLIHRDIKPSNLMLSVSGSMAGVTPTADQMLSLSFRAGVKILDFGLALLQADRAEVWGARGMTTAGTAMGTADYVAPEQISDSHAVDIRADVYSLGCTLYRLLAGQPPFCGPMYRNAFDKMTGHRRDLPSSIRSLRADVPPELAAVMERMMAKNPTERFATPLEVADALAPYTAGADLREVHAEATRRRQGRAAQTGAPAEQVTTPGASSAAQGTQRSSLEGAATASLPKPRRWMRRLASLAVLAGLFGAGLCAEIIILRVKDQHGNVVTESTHTLPPGGSYEVELDGKTVSRPKTYPESTNSRPKATVTSRFSWQPGPADNILPGLVSRPAAIPGIHRWQLETTVHRDTHLQSVAWSPDGRLIAYSSGTTVRIVDAQTLEPVRIMLGHSAVVTTVAWDGQGAILASGGFDETVRLWRADGTPGPVCKLGARAWSLAWHPDGERFAVGCYYASRVELWNKDGALQCTIDTPSDVLAWNADGQWLASAGLGDRAVRLWKSSGDPGPALQGHADGVTSIAWSRDGRSLASAGKDGTVRLWKLDGTPGPILQGHKGIVLGVAWSPDGQWVASAGEDTSVRLWKPDGTSGAILQGHSFPVNGVHWCPDGRRLVSESQTDGLIVWEMGDNPRQVRRAAEWGLDSVAVRPDGTRLAGISHRWSPRSRLIVHGLDQAAPELATAACWMLASVACSPAGEQLATGGEDGTVRLWNSDGTPQRVTHHASRITALAWHPHAKQLALATPEKIELWEAAKTATKPQLVSDGHAGGTWSVAWSPDGQQLASGGADRIVRLWDADGKPVKTLEGHAAEVSSVAWSNDGKWLASGSNDGAVRLWHADGTPGPVVQGEPGLPVVVWDPSDQWLVQGGADELRFLGRDGARGRSWRAPNIRFALDSKGQRIATGGHEDVIRIWGLDGTPITQFGPASVPVNDISWHQNEVHLASASWDGVLRMWNTKTGHPDWIAIPFADGTAATFSTAGQILHGNPAVLEKRLVYVVQRTQGGPQELLSYRDFQALARVLDAEPSDLPDRDDRTRTSLKESAPADTPDSDTIDLLKLIDPQQHVVLGDWSLREDVLVSGAGDPAIVQVPYIPPAEYEITMVVERLGGSGHLSLASLAGGRSFAVRFDAEAAGSVTGLECVDTRRFDANPTTYKGTVMERGRPVAITIRVTKTRLVVKSDSRTLIDWKADYRQCCLDGSWVIPARQWVSLAARQSQFKIRQVRVRPLSEESQSFPWQACPGPSEILPHDKPLRIGEWVDLLPHVDLQHGARNGDWWREAGSIIAAPAVDWGADLALPVLVNGSYKLEAEFVRQSGDTFVSVSLPVGYRCCPIKLSEMYSAAHCLSGIERRRYDENPTSVRPGTLLNGQRYKLQATVRTHGNEAQVEILLDGKALTQWQGAISSLNESCGDDTGRPFQQPALIVAGAAVEFGQVRFCLESGEAHLLGRDSSNQGARIHPRTPRFGSAGVWLFDDVAPQNSKLVGFRYRTDAQTKVLRGLQSVYRVAGDEAAGGSPEAVKKTAIKQPTVVGKDGYSVGGLVISTWADRDGITGMKVVFMRQDGDRLDVHDCYESDWIGIDKGNPIRLGAAGQKITGVFGTEDRSLASLGLIHASDAESPNRSASADVLPLTQLQPFYKRVGALWFEGKRSSDTSWALLHLQPQLPERFRFCEEFLFAHAPSKLTYDLPADAKSFTAVGYCLFGGDVKFCVAVDGKRLFESEEAGIVPIRVDLPTGAKSLELEVEDLGDMSNDWSHWLLPRLHATSASEVADLDGTVAHHKLSELKPTTSQVGAERFMVNEVVGRAPPIHLVKEKPCPEYILAHAPSQVTYWVPDGVKEFSAVGYCVKSNSVKFRVFADGRQIYASPVAGVVPIRVAWPKNANKLDLVVDPVDDNRSDHSFWCYPRLHLEKPIE